MIKPTAQRRKVLYIKGLPDNRMATVLKMKTKDSDIKLHLPGNNNLDGFGFLPNAINNSICLSGEQIKIAIPNVVVNCLADPDFVENKLKNLDKMIANLKKANPKLRVINPPAGILKTRRDDISNLFQGLDGVIVPRAIKCVPEGRKDFIEKIKAKKLKLPVLIREAGVHGGINLTLLESFKDSQIDKLDKFALDGKKSYYVTEFKDFQSKDGYYRKVRIIMIDGVPNLRHMIVSDHWNIHADSRSEFMSKHHELAEEEKKFLLKGADNFSKATMKSLEKIYKTLDLNVFGIDAGFLSNGDLVVFEINAAMEFIAPHVKHAPYIMNQINSIKANFMRSLLGTNASAN